MDIVDAHHHFINAPALVNPWIESRPAALTGLLPNYYDAAHPYLPPDYRADVSAVPVTVVNRMRSLRPCSSVQVICPTFLHGIAICR